MGKYKGTTIVFLRRFLGGLGDGKEQALRDQLSPDELELYETSQSMSWLPAEAAASVLEKASQVAFPGDPERLQKLGVAQAHDHLTGIYRLLLRVTTIPFVIGQSAKLWSTYHDTGRARVEREADEKRGTLIVEGYPELPRAISTMSVGYVHGTLELTKVKDISVVPNFSDPNEWRWEVTWS